MIEIENNRLNRELLMAKLDDAKWFLDMIARIEADIALARHKLNSSYYMRKEGHELIVKMEGHSKDVLISEIVRMANILDDANIAMPKYIYPQYMPHIGDPHYLMKGVS